MSEKVSAGWLTGYDGNKFAPKTFFQEVLNANGARIFANLDTNDDLGSATKPVYIDNGQFKACDDFIGGFEIVESGSSVYVKFKQNDTERAQFVLESGNNISITHIGDTDISISADNDKVEQKVHDSDESANEQYAILTKWDDDTTQPSGKKAKAGYSTAFTINPYLKLLKGKNANFTLLTLRGIQDGTTGNITMLGSRFYFDKGLYPDTTASCNLGGIENYWYNVCSRQLTLYGVDYDSSDDEVTYKHTELLSSYAYFYGSAGNTTISIFHGNNYGSISINTFNTYDANDITLSGRTGTVTAVAFNATSDARLKENFKTFKPEKSILDLPVYKFDFINGAKNQIGCKAQDLQLICPELVEENEKGYLTVKESKIVYLLLEKMKEMQKEINELKGV